jgi:hypothetical protein
MVTRRPRVAFICNEETKDFIEEWAKAERRSVSNLIESIVEDAVTVKKSGKSEKDSLAVALDLLRSLIDGKPLTLTQIAKLANETDLSEEELLKLRDRSTLPTSQ